MKVLLVQDQAEVRERVAFALESKFGAQVMEAPTVREALSLSETDIDLVIWDVAGGDPLDLQSLWLATVGSPYIVCRSNPGSRTLPKELTIVGEVDRSDMVEATCRIVGNLMSEGKIAAEENLHANYCRIRTRLLLSVVPLKGDIYIRLNETKYVKLFAVGDVFNVDDLEKYTTRKGVEFLYLKKEDTPEFIEKYNTDLQKLLSSNQVSIENVLAKTAAIQETAQTLVATVGFTPQVQQLARTHVALTVKSMGKSPRLNALLDRIKNAKGKYISVHSNLVAYVACGIASSLEWASEATYQKLSLAAFLHDITLANADMSPISTLTELQENESKFTPQEVRDYKFHPIRAAELSRQIPQVLPDVDTIILQHHEWPDGSGFPRAMTSATIHPLSSVFIVAHDFVRQMLLRNGGKPNVAAYIKMNSARYSGGHFRKILKAMEALKD